MKLSFEETLIDVWRQALVENAKAIELGTERFPVRWLPSAAFRRWTSYSMVMRFVALSKTRKRNLDGPRWVMQFLSEGRYVANVVNGNVTLYVRRTEDSR